MSKYTDIMDQLLGDIRGASEAHAKHYGSGWSEEEMKAIVDNEVMLEGLQTANCSTTPLTINQEIL